MRDSLLDTSSERQAYWSLPDWAKISPTESQIVGTYATPRALHYGTSLRLLYRGDTDTPPPSPPSPPTSVISRIFAVVLAMGYQTKATAAADCPRNKIL